MIPGVDVSDNNGPLDNLTLAAYLLSKDPNAFAIVKVTESTTYINKLLDQQRLGLHAAGIKWVGLYHFGRPSEASGHAEAEFFLAKIGDHGGILKGEFLCLDLEDDRVDGTASLQAYVDDFRGVVERALGVKVVVYSGAYYLGPHNVTLDPADYWCATWGASTPPVAAIWQYGIGTVPGVAGPVDLDRLLSPLDSFVSRHCWGYQADPVAALPPTGSPDLDKATDVETTLKHVIAKLQETPPAVATAIADLSQCLAHNFGLLGA